MTLAVIFAALHLGLWQGQKSSAGSQDNATDAVEAQTAAITALTLEIARRLFRCERRLSLRPQGA
jgi:hypothetical protein